MKKDDTCYVTKTVDQDNKGRKEVTYCVCVEDDPGQLESLSFRQLEALSAFLCDYVREEKSKEGGDLLCLVREFFTETGMLPAEIAYHGRRLRYDPVAANAVIKGALDEDAYIGRNGLE